ncbi:hypothetical protein [Clostridium sp. UBA6640]|uniref:hypothetical protein n=1 Tax=Clostridium sp. UBA6640 TaxID=1946370 RepID=UPI0025C17719|nr:hypothetical protein [Clostridium sp. UBA6640]
MYFVNVRYKTYEWSTRATILSGIGAVLKAFCWICICSIGMLSFGIFTATNPTYTADLKVIIPVVLVIGIILAVIGGLVQKKAEKISLSDFENKVKNDFKFAKKMAKKDLENKEWYMSQNSEYAEYVLSGRADLDTDEDNINEVKKVKVGQLILTAIIAIVFIFGGMYLLGSFS